MVTTVIRKAGPDSAVLASLARAPILLIAATLLSPSVVEPRVQVRSRMTVVAEIPSEGPGYTLSRVGGVVALDDGSLLVSDLGERALFRFTASGEFVTRVGRAGDGPGEFRLPVLMGRSRGGVWLSDPMLRRVTTFSDDFRTVRTRRLTSAGAAVLTEDGSVLVFQNDRSSVRGPAPKQQTTTVVRLGEDGAARTVATWIDDDGVLSIAAGPGVFNVDQPFVDRILWAIDPGGRHLLVVSKGATSGQVRILRLGPAGDTTGVASLEVPPVTVTETRVTRTVDSVVRVLSGPAKQRTGVDLSAGAVRSALIRPASRGGVAEALSAPDGRAWLRLHSQGSVDGNEWIVVDPATGSRSYVTSPRGIRIVAVGPETVLGVREENGEAPRIVVLRVTPM